ncbi:unnamed protein product [Lepidochelys kempii]
MAKSSARLQLELAKFQAEEKQREHERQIELMQLKKEQEREAEQHQEAAHKREMEARKHVEEEREKERKHVEEMERIKAQQNIPTNPSNPSPGTTSHPRKFPTYKAGDDTEAFLENFERACLGYNISTDQYMVELRPQLSGPLAEVAAEMPKEHMNKYELFKSKARVRMGITPEQSRRRFRALRWKPDMSFTRHAYHIVKHWDAWISGASVESPVNLPFLMQMEQFLEGVPEEIERYILDGKPKTVIEAGEIGARWVEVAEKKKTGRSWSGDQKGPPQTTPYYRGPPKAPPTSQRTLQTPYRPTTPFSSNPPRPSDPSAGRCFKCNELGHVKANCPKNPNRLQFIAPESHQRSTGPDTSQIPLERRETVSVGGKKVTAWRDTGAQVSAIHASLVDPNLINPEIQVTIQPFKSNSFNLPTAKLPVQYKGWSGMWTFAVYDDYPIPMLLGEDLANHVKQAKRVGMVTRNQAKQAVRPSSVPETSIRTQSEVMDLDPRPMSATAVVDPVPETQTEPVPEPEPAEQPTPDPVSALNPVLATSTPEGPTEPELAAADNPTQEAQPEPESQHSAPAESGSQSTETAPSPISLPEGPSLGPQSHEELMSPASREQFQTEQEADESLQRAWTAARSNPPPLSSSNRSRFVVERGLLYKETLSGGHQEDWHPQRQLVVPTKYRAKLLSLAHDHPSGHAGVNRTKDRSGGSFHWEGMGKDVSTYVQSCEVCQRVGKPQDQVKAPLQPLPIIEVPFQRVAVDILGPFPKKTPRGKQYILTFMDFATRWPEAVALSNTRAKSVCQALADIFARVGWPSDILTDAGTNFLAGTMKNLWEAHGVNHLVATPYHHQTNGMVEKVNGTLGAMIRKFVNEHSNDWDLVLQQLLFAYRAVPHPSLGFSPFELVYGREVKGPWQLVKQQWEGFTPSPGTNILDFVTNLQTTLRTSLALARENLQDAQKEQKAWYDKHARERSFKVGDQVMVLKALQAHKMEASWEGPFVVQERLGAVNYLIAFPTSNRKPKVYHINSLKPFYSRELKVCQFTAQGGDDAEWPEGVYYEGKCAGGVEEVNLSMTLGRMQRQQIQELCTSYAPTFSATPGLTERAYHSIDTGNAHPIRVQPYRVSPQAKTAIEREIQDMLQMGVIRPSESAWASPVVLVPKPDGEIRFCVDYRKLNAVTRPDNYPMPRTDELLEKLGRAQFISTLDLTKGYWQVPLDESAKERSAFITHLGLYEFNVLPFGLRNAPATFQRLVDGLLAGLGEYAVAYLDDVAIFSDSWADHLEHLQKVLERIREAGLTVKAKKCQIGLNRVTYLGHQVGQGTISPLQAKVDAIQKWPVPKSKKQVQSFLGLAGYYRRFVPHYSQIAAPLTDLTKKKQPNAVQWTGKCQKAFNKLKATLMSDPVLRAPDFDKPFLVTTDASERGVGAVLMQKGPDQEFHPVVFLSKKLSERESNWSVTEKECYAIVYALEKLRPYVWGRRFHLQTDHAALKWLHTIKETNKKLLRWSLALQDFDFDIQHISGASNKVADALSRESFPESTG